MSSSTQNDLQLGKNNSNRFLADQESRSVLESMLGEESSITFSRKVTDVAPATDDAKRHRPQPPFRDPPRCANPHEFSTLIPLGITRKELDCIKLTAQFVAIFGRNFYRDLKERVVNDPRFEFMKQAHRRHFFYTMLFVGYHIALMLSRKLSKDGDSTEAVLEVFFSILLQGEKQDGGMMDLLAFEYFANTAEEEPLPPGRLSMMMNANPLVSVDAAGISYLKRYFNHHTFYQQHLAQDLDGAPATEDAAQGHRHEFSTLFPEGTTLKELDYIKLTAQFVAVFGDCFLRGLKEKVAKDPQFEFMEPTDSRHYFYSMVLAGYLKALMPSRKLSKDGASTETVLEVFFSILFRGVKHDGVVEMGMMDFLAFEYFANTAEEESRRQPGQLSLLMKPLVSTMPGTSPPPPPLSL